MTLTQVTKAGLHDIALDHVFTIGASGTDHYTFQGEGLNGTVNDPTLYLKRGQTYRFENGTGAHAIRIQSADDGTSGTLYNTGVTNNNTTGTVIVEVQHDAPDVLYYQCAAHANMKGTIYITGALADGGVTTAKLADDAVTDAKLANAINTAIAANTAKTSNATHTGDVTGSTSLTIAADAVDGTKIADDSINSEHYVDGSIDTAHIADDAVTDAKLANAINTAIAANTAKTTNATHTGEVTGGTALTIADNVVDEANLKVSNSPTNGYMLTAQSGNTGGLTWAEAGGGKIIQTYVIKSTSDITNSNPSTGVYYPLETAAITVSAGTTLHIFANYHYWIQGRSHIIYGTQGLQAEVGGSGSWSTIRDPGGYESYSVATVASGGGTPGDYINQIADIASLNTYWTHGQSAGSTVKIRIYHNHQYCSNCIFMNFGRYGTERNIIVYEVSS